jgi:hypothetical protein
MLTRVRVQLEMSKFCLVLFCASCMLAGLLLLYMWPFSRTAVLIPLAWWAMYVINKWSVGRPVFGLIDEVAEKAGFYPVYPKGAQQVEGAEVNQREPDPVTNVDVLAGNPSIATAK